MGKKQKDAIEAVADAVESVEDIESSDLCACLAELAFKLFWFVNESDLDPTYVRGMGETHDWIRVGDYNVDYGAVQYDKPFPFVTRVDSKKAVNFYGDWPLELISKEPNQYFPSVEKVASGEVCNEVLHKALTVFEASMERAGWGIPPVAQ